MDKRRILISALAAAGCWLGNQTEALAQATPAEGPLKIVVATPPGGASDAAARLLAQTLTRNLGRQAMVENRAGGNGIPAVQAVLAAPPNGQTLLWAMSSMAGMPQLVKSSPIRSMNELAPVASVVNLVYGVLVNPKIPAKNIAEFTAHLKVNPDRLSYGTAVLGEYMATMHYLRSADLKALRVPYKGGAQLLPDLITGELDFYIGPLAPTLVHVKSGKLRLLATLPDKGEVVQGVPALAEAGIPIDTLPAWNGLMAPPKTPADVAARLSQDINKALADPALRSALEALGFRVTGGTPQQMASTIDSASNTWRQFIRDYNIPQE